MISNMIRVRPAAGLTLVAVLVMTFTVVGNLAGNAVSPAPVAAFPCPDGSNNCGPNPGGPTITPPQAPTQGSSPTQGGDQSGGNVLPTGQPGATESPGAEATGSADTPAVPTQPGCIVGCNTTGVGQEPPTTSAAAPNPDSPAGNSSVGFDYARLCQEARAQVVDWQESLSRVIAGPGNSMPIVIRTPIPPQFCPGCIENLASSRYNTLYCRRNGPVSFNRVEVDEDSAMIAPGAILLGESGIHEKSKVSVTENGAQLKLTAGVSGEAGASFKVFEAKVGAEAGVEYVFPSTDVTNSTERSIDISPSDRVPVGSYLQAYPRYIVVDVPVSCNTPGVFDGRPTRTMWVFQGITLWAYTPAGKRVPIMDLRQ